MNGANRGSLPLSLAGMRVDDTYAHRTKNIWRLAFRPLPPPPPVPHEFARLNVENREEPRERVTHLGMQGA